MCILELFSLVICYFITFLTNNRTSILLSAGSKCFVESVKSRFIIHLRNSFSFMVIHEYNNFSLIHRIILKQLLVAVRLSSMKRPVYWNDNQNMTKDIFF